MTGGVWLMLSIIVLPITVARHRTTARPVRRPRHDIYVLSPGTCSSIGTRTGDDGDVGLVLL